MTDTPDEVRCAAYTDAKRTGRFPQWWADLLADKHVGPVPSCSHPEHDSMARGQASVGLWPRGMMLTDAEIRGSR